MSQLSADNLQPKRCKESLAFRTGRVFPNDMNNHDTLFGGKLMSLIDEVASISAIRHCRATVVTASTDSVDFLRPIHKMDSVCLESYVTYVGRTSLEVFVKVVSEDLFTGERHIAATSFLTFVAMDDDGNPTQVPPVIPETEEEFVYENFRIFVKWALTLLDGNEKFAEQGKPEAVFDAPQQQRTQDFLRKVLK